MKKMKFLVALLFMFGLLTVVASAQQKSLRNVTEKDVFESDDDGFEISLPEAWVSIKEVPGGTRYQWDVKEGMIAVIVREEKTPRGSAEIDKFIADYKNTLVSEGEAKIVGEAPAKIGDYRGKLFNTVMDGEKNHFIVLLYDKFSVVIHGRAAANVAGSDELIGEAMKSFEFVSDDD